MTDLYTRSDIADAEIARLRAEIERMREKVERAYFYGIYDQQHSKETLDPAKTWPLARAALKESDQ